MEYLWSFYVFKDAFCTVFTSALTTKTEFLALAERIRASRRQTVPPHHTSFRSWRPWPPLPVGPRCPRDAKDRVIQLTPACIYSVLRVLYMISDYCPRPSHVDGPLLIAWNITLRDSLSHIDATDGVRVLTGVLLHVYGHRYATIYVDDFICK
jgi:hypothetical protein